MCSHNSTLLKIDVYTEIYTLQPNSVREIDVVKPINSDPLFTVCNINVNNPSVYSACVTKSNKTGFSISIVNNTGQIVNIPINVARFYI